MNRYHLDDGSNEAIADRAEFDDHELNVDEWAETRRREQAAFDQAEREARHRDEYGDADL